MSSAGGAGTLRVGIVGTGGIGFAYAAWLADGAHKVTIWSPGGAGAAALRSAPLEANGVLTAQVAVGVAPDAQALARDADVLVIAVPVNGHRAVMDALLPHLRDGHLVLVSSMSSLSSLYLYEAARRAGRDVTVMSLGTTVLTARREGPARVRVMMRRVAMGVSALPTARVDQAVGLCGALFGAGFSAQANDLATALTNINPVAHAPLAIFNWTRIERAENWPQYHYMTARVAAVIEALDRERRDLAGAFGLTVRSIEEHFAQSFSTTADSLTDIAAELHAKRGGPPGPTDIGTRFLAEDVPFGLVFSLALADVAGLPLPATRTMVATASLIAGRDFAADNDLIGPLALASETTAGLLSRMAR